MKSCKITFAMEICRKNKTKLFYSYQYLISEAFLDKITLSAYLHLKSKSLQSKNIKENQKTA